MNAQLQQHFEGLTQLVEDQLRWMESQRFTAADESGAVSVTLNGELTLVGLQIEDGLLRLGADTVERRINEALVNARTQGSEALSVQAEQLADSLSGLAGEMVETVEAQMEDLRQLLLPRS